MTWTSHSLVLALLGCGARPSSPPRPPLADNTCTNNVTPIAGGIFVVDATWRGIPVKVSIDTGAVGGQVSSKIVQRYNLPSVGSTEVGGVGGSTAIADLHDVGPLRVGSVEIDGANFNATSAFVDQFDFTIGIEQLRGHAMVLDLGGRSFCLGPSPNPLATTPMRLAGDPEHGQAAIVSAHFSSYEGPLEFTEMMIDTAAGVVALREDLASRLGYAFEAPREVTDTLGRTLKLPNVRVPQICVTKTCVHDQLVSSMPDLRPLIGFEVDGVIGVPLLQGRRLVIDFPAKRFSLTAHSDR